MEEGVRRDSVPIELLTPQSSQDGYREGHLSNLNWSRDGSRASLVHDGVFHEPPQDTKGLGLVFHNNKIKVNRAYTGAEDDPTVPPQELSIARKPYTLCQTCGGYFPLHPLHRCPLQPQGIRHIAQESFDLVNDLLTLTLKFCQEFRIFLKQEDIAEGAYLEGILEARSPSSRRATKWPWISTLEHNLAPIWYEAVPGLEREGINPEQVVSEVESRLQEYCYCHIEGYLPQRERETEWLRRHVPFMRWSWDYFGEPTSAEKQVCLHVVVPFPNSEYEKP